jgi:hypothetical protein
MGMTRRALSAAIAASVSTVLVASPQSPTTIADAFVAFRVDDERVVAVIKVLDDADPSSPPAGLSEPPRFGFRPFDATARIRAAVGATLSEPGRWSVHLSPGLTVRATLEKIVGGNLGCVDSAGALLRLDRASVNAFAGVKERYFVAERGSSPQAPSPGTRVKALAPASRADVERALDNVLRQEWPRVRDDTEDEVAAMAASTVDYHRSWAAERRQLQAALDAGDATRSFDVQTFHLDPDGTPVSFVRGEWRVGTKLGFVATLWITGGATPKVIRLDVSAAGWLRMFEFGGDVGREQLGLVLNVVDRDRDGWREVLFARGGYESMGVDLLEYSPAGLVATGISYSYGC